MRTKDKQRTLIKGAQVVFPHHVAPADVLVDNGSIALIGTDLLPERYDAAVHDAQGCYLTPGFIDMHVHGGGNCRFGDANIEAVYTVLQMHLQHGTTSIMPTISSYSKETIDASLDVLETVRTETPEQPLPEILGVHMEGPYFAAAQQGAQNPAAIRMPDPKEYLSILEHPIPIKRWSAACELPGALQFARDLTQRGVMVSIGHSNASFHEVQIALEYGYRSITHFYSGCSSLHRIGPWRHAGVVEAGLYFDELWVEVIADGCHLPESLLRLIYKTKGPDQICLVTDAIRAAGVPDAENFYAGGSPDDASHFIVKDGVAMLQDGTAFAGSIATTDRLVRTMVNIAKVPLAHAVRMSTLTPARILGIDRYKGSVTEGKDADLVVLDSSLHVRQVYRAGVPLLE